MRITIAWLGKTRSAAARASTEEYLARMRQFARMAPVEGCEFAGPRAEAALAKRAAGANLWLCDPAGRRFDSEAFAHFIEREAALGRRELFFAVGGADGFPPGLSAAAAGRLSLSPLTLSHELARLVLLEQVYRALAILNHHPYPH